MEGGGGAWRGGAQAEPLGAGPVIWETRWKRDPAGGGIQEE